MKIRFIPKRKLRAATAARRMPRAAAEDYAQEPNISFGRAIIVVVVLHLVAVAGICVFSSLKARSIAQQNAALRSAKEADAQPAAGAPSKTAGQPATQEIQSHGMASTAPAATPVKQITATSFPAGPANPPVSETASTIKDSGSLYTVARGDTPVSIAKKLHVGYDDLLKLNKITDPKKLKIGQKLRIPMKKKAASTTRAPAVAEADDAEMS